jgi:8-oxo-dGTP diphosphatase
MPNVIASVKALIVHKGRFLVLEQKLPATSFWDLPGGKIHYGESPMNALLREVKEETGLEIDIEEPIGVWYFFRQDTNDQVVCSTFLCRPDSDKVDSSRNPGTEKIVSYRWVTKEEFMKLQTSLSLKELIEDAEI